MNAKMTSLAIAIAAFASGSAAFAQCVQVTGPATVTSETVQVTGTPTVSSSQVLPAANACATSGLLETRSFAAVVEPSPKVLVSPHPVLDLGMFGKRLFGFGRVIRDWDLR